MISPAYAQAAGSIAQPGGMAATIQFFAPFLLVFVAFYVMILRPQQRKQKAFAAAIAAVKKGDQVITAGGIAGRVTRVEDRFVEVEIAANVRVRVIKTTLTEIVDQTVKPAND